MTSWFAVSSDNYFIFDLGTLYITTSGKGKGDTPQTATIPGFQVTFTSSKITKALGIKKIVISDSSPIIGTMTDLFTNEEETSFTAGTSTRKTYSPAYSNTVAILMNSTILKCEGRQPRYKCQSCLFL